MNNHWQCFGLHMTKSSKQVLDYYYALTEYRSISFCLFAYFFALPSLCTVYELKTTEQRRNDHMKYGLILCSRTLNNGAEISNVFFTSVAQLNLAGPDAVPDPSQKIVIAGLNLKAGRLSNTLSDYMAAFTFFKVFHT